MSFFTRALLFSTKKEVNGLVPWAKQGWKSDELRRYPQEDIFIALEKIQEVVNNKDGKFFDASIEGRLGKMFNFRLRFCQRNRPCKSVMAELHVE